MKKVIMYVVVFLSGAFVQAQTLSGTIKYDVKYDMSPEQKTQMEMYGAIPTQMELMINGTSSKMKMISAKGTMMEILHLKDGSYFLDRTNKKAYKMPDKSANPNANNEAPKVTKTDEFETIAGHKCRKYIIEHGGNQQLIWATTDFKLSPEVLANMAKRGMSDNSAMKEIDGLPLKMSGTEHNNKVEMVASSISTTKPADSELTLPSDYSIEPFNPMVMGQMMGGGAPPHGGPHSK